MARKVALLIIDPQKDFHGGGSLAVTGADEDAARIAALVRGAGAAITSVYVTLDSHQRTHIAHGIFWRDAEGNPPSPFTTISAADVEAGKWTPVDESKLEHAKFYTKALEAGGRFQLLIWPEHCILGSPGHCVQDEVLAALHEWVDATRKEIRYVFKGQNVLTEMYSAIRAEVVQEDDPSTALNAGLIEELRAHDAVIVCGQAMSHCVNYTLRDIVGEVGEGEASKFKLLSDGASAVSGFEAQATQFVEDMRAKGVTVCSCEEAMS